MSGMIGDIVRDLTRAIKELEDNRVIRVLSPEEWTSTEKADISFHTCTENCHTASEGESSVCEVTEAELRKAYLGVAAHLSTIRFMMGVPGTLGRFSDEGIESYEEAKARADERARELRGE